MKLIFVRHGPKLHDDTQDDAELPLAPSAYDRVERLAAALELGGLLPRVIVSSRYRHAHQTAERLRRKGPREVLPVTALTPHTPEVQFTMTTILSEAMQAGFDLLRDCDVLMLVGHKPRLTQLAEQLLGEEPAALSALEALVVDWHGTLQTRIAG